MSIWTRLGRLFTVDDTILDEDFTLTPDDEQSDVAQSKPQNDDKQASEAGQNADANVNDQEGEQEQTDEEQRPEQDAGPASGPKRRNTRYLKPTKIGVRAQQEAEKQQDTDPQEKGQSEKEHQETDSNEKQSTGKRSQEQYSNDKHSADKQSNEKHSHEKQSHPKQLYHKQSRKPQKINAKSRQQNVTPKRKSKQELEAIKQQPLPETLTDQLDVNRVLIEKIYHLPLNADVIIRDFTINSEVQIKAFAVFMEGLSDKTIINNDVLEPLMLLSSLPPRQLIGDRLTQIKEQLLPGNQVMEYDKWDDVRKNILTGSTALFLEGVNKALIIETKGWEHRSVGDTKTESVVRGPHDAFTENLRSNTGLVRSRLRTERLITEMMQVGELAPTDIAVMYVEGIVNPKLVKEVKRRIKAIQTDFLQDSGTLEQFIEDPPGAFLPKMMATERPDRVASSLYLSDKALMC